LVFKGAGGWDFNGCANPKIFQMPDNTYAIQYNGSDDVTNEDFEIGFATANAKGGPYTKLAANPVGGHTTGNYGVETAHFSWDEDGVSYFNVCQRFDTASSTAHAFAQYQEKYQGGLLVSRDPTTFTDGAIAGVIQGAGTFTAESRTVILAHRTNNGTPIILGIWDEASLPTPTTLASFNAVRRLEIQRNTHDRSAPGDLFFFYWDGTNTRQWWNGSIWQSGNATPFAADYAREVLARIQDDGTNYVLSAYYADDMSTIVAPVSILKTTVHSTTNRMLLAGDPSTDSWCQSLYLRRFSVRPYTATEPAITAGPFVQSEATFYTFTPPTPASGTVNVPSGPFRVTPNGP
jgi:hypothetical protein